MSAAIVVKPACKETLKSISKEICNILSCAANNNHDSVTTIKALDCFEKSTSINNTSIMNCNFTGIK